MVIRAARRTDATDADINPRCALCFRDIARCAENPRHARVRPLRDKAKHKTVRISRINFKVTSLKLTRISSKSLTKNWPV